MLDGHGRPRRTTTRVRRPRIECTFAGGGVPATGSSRYARARHARRRRGHIPHPLRAADTTIHPIRRASRTMASTVLPFSRSPPLVSTVPTSIPAAPPTCHALPAGLDASIMAGASALPQASGAHMRPPLPIVAASARRDGSGGQPAGQRRRWRRGWRWRRRVARPAATMHLPLLAILNSDVTRLAHSPPEVTAAAVTAEAAAATAAEVDAAPVLPPFPPFTALPLHPLAENTRGHCHPPLQRAAAAAAAARRDDDSGRPASQRRRSLRGWCWRWRWCWWWRVEWRPFRVGAPPAVGAPHHRRHPTLRSSSTIVADPADRKGTIYFRWKCVVLNHIFPGRMLTMTDCRLSTSQRRRFCHWRNVSRNHPSPKHPAALPSPLAMARRGNQLVTTPLTDPDLERTAEQSSHGAWSSRPLGRWQQRLVGGLPGCPCRHGVCLCARSCVRTSG